MYEVLYFPFSSWTPTQFYLAGNRQEEAALSTLEKEFCYNSFDSADCVTSFKFGKYVLYQEFND